MTATFQDWVELLGVDAAVHGLLAGEQTLSEARREVAAARHGWFSVSHDHLAVLDQLEPFFDRVGEAIDEQRRVVQAFNQAATAFGREVPVPDDRLLTETDVAHLRAAHLALASDFAELRRRAGTLDDEIGSLLGLLESLLGGLGEDDPFAEQEIEDLTFELQELFDEMAAGQCLPG